MTNVRVPVGILGGTFDPIHYGHIALAQSACRGAYLTKVILIPAGIPPHKASTIVASASDRIAMCSLAAKDVDFELEISDIELARTGPSYTLDTLIWLTKNHPEYALHFIIGSDNLSEVLTWYRWRDLFTYATFLVLHRPGFTLDIPTELNGLPLTVISSPELDISSTLIRRNIREGRSLENLVPLPVAQYIQAHRLYL